MAIYVYITKNCRENAITHGRQEDLARFEARVEKAQSLELFANFPPPYLVKRKFGGDQGRLIAKHVRLKSAPEHTIVCFLAVLIRGSKDYDRGFGIDPVGWGDQNLKDLYTESELEDWLLGRLDKSIPEPPPPSDVESEFLHTVANAATGGEDDWTVAERKEWFHRVGQEDVKPHHGPLFEALDAVVKKARRGEESYGVEGVGNTWAIRWSAYPVHKLVVLEDVVPVGTGAMEPQDSGANSRSEILQSCRRAYPDIVTADQAQWLNIQRDSEGNLALSPEEEEVIESARPGNSAAFPLFINGRAGSGKSTVLQYLFADYLMKYIEVLDRGGLRETAGSAENQQWPSQGAVYFTCSRELLSKARTTVEIILRNGAQYWDKPERRSMIERHKSDIDKAFCELRGYLLSLVPENERHLFDERNYVSFPRFQRLWTEKFGRDRSAMKEYGPALSWHVIRTHIKGASADDLLDPEEYELLEKKQRTVSSDDYRLIFDKVWDKWYRKKCEGDRLWDDQDLARHLLEHDLVAPVFHAIFCDESQDFTSVELQAILRLSIFSRRKLRISDVSRVPFVFAGDPFQTLNPTGFRWESTKASYFKNFVLSLNPWGDPDTSLNYKELSHNYRSSRSIVGLCNLIQARRSQLFRMTSVKPQEIWTGEETQLPVYWFASDDNEFWAEFCNQKDLVVITPCPEGCESQYVQEDPQLKARIHVKGDTPENVWSAIRSKGLEFNRVVLYGFGSTPEALELHRQTPEQLEEDAGKRLPLEYFFNQLYVGASRAKHSLFVVDSRQGIERFWGFASSQPLDELLGRIPGGPEKWRKHVEQMVEGQVDILRTGHYDAARMASELEKQGVSGENAFIMRQAAVHYRNADNHVAAELCETRALLYEEKYSEAARAFFKQQRWEDAIRAYWMDGTNGRRELCRVGREEEEIKKRLEWRLADALNNNLSGIQLWNDLFDEVVRHARKEGTNWNPELRKGWSDSILSAVARVVDSKKEVARTDQWLEIVHRISDIERLGLCSVMPINHAVLAARAGQYPDARRFFMEAGLDEESLDGQPTEFLETVAKCQPWPKNLRALELLGQRAAIIREWEVNPAALQVAADVATVASCLIQEGREPDALPLAGKIGQIDDVMKCAEKFLAKGDSQNARRALQVAFLLLGKKGDYKKLLQISNSSISRTASQHGTWRDFLGEAFPLWIAKTLAGGEESKDAQVGHKLVDILKAAWPIVNPSSEGDVRLWGTAIERTAQINPAIEFYDGILPKCPVESSHEALRQWIRSRSLKAKWKRTLTASAKRRVEETRTDQIGIKNELEKWRLGAPDSLPEFPERISFQKALEDLLSPSWKGEDTEEPVVAEPPPPPPTPVVVAVPQAVPQVEKLQFLGFDFQINRTKKRLTITRPPDDNRVRVEAGSGKECDSDLPAEQVGEASWKIPEWGIRVEWIENAERPQVIVRWQEQGLELRFDLP